MKNFTLVLEQGHLFLSDDQGSWFIVDTGSPTTVYESSQLQFMGRVHAVSTNYMGLTVDSLRGFIPHASKRIVGLLGNDVLARYWFELDVRAGMARFGEGIAPERQNSFSFQDLMSVPLISMVVEGQTLRAFLDSGANLSYVKSSVSMGWESLGIKQDFHPMFGAFESPHFVKVTVVQGKSFEVNYGNLPGKLAATLSLGIDAILGVDLFAHTTVFFDYRNKTIALN
jgi:hypothetical protein